MFGFDVRIFKWQARRDSAPAYGGSAIRPLNVCSYSSHTADSIRIPIALLGQNHWQARRDSNPQHAALETAALPIRATGLRFLPSSLYKLPRSFAPRNLFQRGFAPTAFRNVPARHITPLLPLGGLTAIPQTPCSCMEF